MDGILLCAVVTTHTDILESLFELTLVEVSKLAKQKLRRQMTDDK